MVVSQKMIVKIIAMVFLFFKKNTEIPCPIIAPINDIIIIITELFGALSKISIPISNIFCTIAVEIARKAPMGKSNRTYFFVIFRMLGSDCLIVEINGFV